MSLVKLTFVGLVTTALVAAFVTPFVWIGWNDGMSPALFFAGRITLFQAFCMSLFFSSVGSMLKSATLTVDSKE
jgi:hypothetical protein